VGKIFAIFIQAVIAFFAVLMILYGYSYAILFLSERTPAVGINALWLNLSLPMCGLLILLYSQLNILKILKPPGKNHRDP
jgi:TRAP-type C4-dicarboxylate transport system permease small subunit